MKDFDVGDDVCYMGVNGIRTGVVKISYVNAVLTEEHELIPKKECFHTKITAALAHKKNQYKLRVLTTTNEE